MQIQKNTGEIEKFSEAKLCNSIRASGAPKKLTDEVCHSVKQKIPENGTTTNIFRQTLHYLMKEDIDIAVAYSLARGLEKLGPTGFRFEQYIEALFQAYGYKTKRNQMIKGKCITHEVDVVLEKFGLTILVEAKYRNDKAIKTHVDVVMYAEARRQDIAEANPKKDYQMLVVTNTKFTETSIKYAKCKDKITLLGWNYPKGTALEDMIIKKKIYPVTVLPFVSDEIFHRFAEKEIILVEDLIPYGVTKLQKEFGLSTRQASQIVKTVAEITK